MVINGTLTAFDESTSMKSRAQEHLPTFSDFELHYDFDGRYSVLRFLESIDHDLSSHSPIHNWDEKLINDPVKDIAKYAKRKLMASDIHAGSSVLAYSSVTEVSTFDGKIRRHYAPERYLPDMKEIKTTLAASRHANSEQSPRFTYGRIVYIKEHIFNAPRAAILLVQAFSLRLHDEDPTFIRRFLQRHLTLKAAYKEPHHLPEASMSGKHYQRVSLSCHLPHLLLQPWQESEQDLKPHDNEFLGYFEPDQTMAGRKHKRCLYKASSSVLLALVVPGEEEYREEAVDLLANCEAFWNVLVVNGPTQIGASSSREPTEFMTPLAQFVRGVSGAVNSQRLHIDSIFEELKKQLAESAGQSALWPSGSAQLFDDQSFSNSKLYHWVIKMCYEICGSIETTLKFVRNFEHNQLVRLQERAHPFEKPGLVYWIERLHEETESLDAVHAEVQAFKEQVKELREALLGATALLESRIAVMQGDRLQLLTYLSMAYLPITTVASIYSMTIIPKEATLASFGILLAIVLLATTFLALNLQNMFSLLLRIQQAALNFIYSAMNRSENPKWNTFTRNPPSLYSQILYSNNIVRTTSNASSIFAFLYDSLKALPACEVAYGLNLFRPVRAEQLPWNIDVRFSSRKLIGDLVRLVFLPVWIVFALPYWLVLGVKALYGALCRHVCGFYQTLMEMWLEKVQSRLHKLVRPLEPVFWVLLGIIFVGPCWIVKGVIALWALIRNRACECYRGRFG